jgi:hypothetical protein
MKQYSVDVEVNGKWYTLQHPGVPAWARVRSEAFIAGTDGKSMRVDFERVLRFGFEHVVIPKRGRRLNLDEWDPQDQAVLEEVWQNLLLNFLRGQPVARTYSSSDWKAKQKNDLRADEPENESANPDRGEEQLDLVAGGGGAGASDPG